MKGKLPEPGKISVAEVEKIDEAVRAANAESGVVSELVKNPLYFTVEYRGTTRVDGEIRDISRRVYQRCDIDWNRIDSGTGLTNLQLAMKGNAPFWNDGTKIELHHILQNEPGSMVEIPSSLHMKGHKVLHGLKGTGESFRNDPVLKRQYENFRTQYWKWRAKNIK